MCSHGVHWTMRASMTGSITLHRVLRCQALLRGCGRHEEVISICLVLIDLFGARYLAVILVYQGRCRHFLREWCHICSMLVLQPSAIYLNSDEGLLLATAHCPEVLKMELGSRTVLLSLDRSTRAGRGTTDEEPFNAEDGGLGPLRSDCMPWASSAFKDSTHHCIDSAIILADTRRLNT